MSCDQKLFPANKDDRIQPTEEGEHILRFESSDHSRRLLIQLAELRGSQLCDVILVAKGTRINAHKVALAACSNYFKAMFTSDMAESRMEEIEIGEMEASTLETLVNFCYSGKIVITDVNVSSILPAACLLQLNEVQEQCCEFLKNELSLSNCLGIRVLAYTYSCQELLQCADTYIWHNFQDILGTEEFHQLPVNQVIELISSDELRVRSEEQVFTAVLQWIRFDQRDRKQFLSNLLEHVRLPFCSPEFLVNTVSDNALVMENLDCRDLIDEAKNYQLLKLSTHKINMLGPRTRPRNVNVREVIYAAGGRSGPKQFLASVERLDIGKGNPVWKSTAPMSTPRFGPGVAVLGSLIYVVGGYDGQHYLNSSERFDSTTCEWSSDIAPMSVCRLALGAAALDGFVYAVGGCNDTECLDTVERYDPFRNEWIRVASLGTRRDEVSVSVLNGCLYAVGGYDRKSALNTVERFDPRVGKWEEIAPMFSRRKKFGSAVLSGQLYAVGGYNSQSLRSAEKYNPLTNEWTAVADMNNVRQGVALVVAEKQLYAVGGACGRDIFLETVEVFDFETGQWRHHSCMNERRFLPGVAVIQLP